MYAANFHRIYTDAMHGHKKGLLGVVLSGGTNITEY